MSSSLRKEFLFPTPQTARKSQSQLPSYTQLRDGPLEPHIAYFTDRQSVWRSRCVGLRGADVLVFRATTLIICFMSSFDISECSSPMTSSESNSTTVSTEEDDRTAAIFPQSKNESRILGSHNEANESPIDSNTSIEIVETREKQTHDSLFCYEVTHGLCIR
jgi:hypothetical protein